MDQQLAIVVPVGPKDQAADLLQQLGRWLPNAEVIGSATRLATDVEIEAARALRLRWIVGPAGRAAQQNRGAAAAGGHWLWFLHTDTRLSEESTAALRIFTTGSTPSIGYFRLSFAADGPKAVRLNAIGANLRSRWLGLPFGDQGFVMPRSTWDRLGGFNDQLEIGEDLDLVVRARAAGIPVVELAAVLTTSSRRYEAAGWLQTTARHAHLTWSLYRAARARLRLNQGGETPTAL